MTLKYFENNVSFQQKIKLKSKSAKVLCNMEYMTCDDHQCLPPKNKDYTFDLKSEIKIDGDIKEEIVEIKIIDTTSKSQKDSSQISSLKSDVANDEPSASEPWWKILLKGMAAGLIALLMPCVFPMIPLTVSFFTKRSTSKQKGLANALIYGFSIIILFMLLGFLVGNSLNKWASSAFFNLAFFAIFILFAISFLGAFEITIPNSWIEKSDKASERGGLIGIFFMAFTMVLVSFSCTGPFITWAINVKSASPIAAVIAMFGFGFIFALPFMFFAFFPGWLQSLPKSGSWLNTIKVSFGFIELAAAFKFYSNVDMAYHWNTLPREAFLVIWIVVFTLLGMYLLGKLKFHHDDDLPKNDYGIPYLTVPRFLFATLSLCFSMYLLTGLWGAPLKLISGFPPPTSYNEGKWTNIYGSNSSSASTAVIPHTIKGPHDLDVFHDYDLALAYAKQNHKPLFVDYTGWSCVNCRKMEESVWSDEKVLNHLRNDYVIVSLYVDDREALPAEKQTKNYEGEIMKTTGDWYTNMQITRHNKNAQPFYVLLDAEEKILTEPSPANFNVEEYSKFLKTGIDNYKK
jgi:thiol:disulfide interchange protein DsbD